MRPHHRLEAWSKSLELVTSVCRRTERFPKEEKFGLTSQIRRAAISIPANVAEGAGRRSPKEFVHFLSNSQGSASELETEPTDLATRTRQHSRSSSPVSNT